MEEVYDSPLELSVRFIGQIEESHRISIQTEEPLLLQEMTVLSAEGILLFSLRANFTDYKQCMKVGHSCISRYYDVF